MHLLLLGYSDIAQRRVLPALAGLAIDRVDIATRSRTASVRWPAGLSGSVYDDYQAALRHSSASLVWISTVNSTHKALASAALDAGKHVVIDKPATTCLADTRELVDQARQADRMLAEACVYPWHPQVAAAMDVFAREASAPRHLLAAFSYPALPADNFRHRPDLGGGILLDLGPYAVSLGRVFFDGAAPQQICCHGDVNDHAISVLMTFSGERTLVGQFGSDSGYVNQLTVLGPRVVVEMKRVFTTPPDQASPIEARVDNHSRRIEVDAADSFARFLAEVFMAIETHDPEPLRHRLLADAEVLERLRLARKTCR